MECCQRECCKTGSLPKEDANQLSEYEAMHEENFFSSWLREDVEGEKAESRCG